MFDELRKKKPKVFSSLESLPCFSQLCVLNNLLGPKKGFRRFHSVCHTSLWTLINCSLMFFTLDNTRKSRSKHLSPWKKLFFEIFLPIDLLGAEEKFLSLEKSLSKHLLGPFRLFQELSMFDITKKKWPKSFLHWRDCLVLKTLCFQQPLRSYKMLLHVPESRSKKILDPYKWFLANFHTR